MITMKGKYNTANIMIDDIDDTTREQIQTFLNHPAFANTYIAIMPDCHAGKGAVIGFTMQINDYIIPNVIGVDIGCLDCNTEVLTCKGWIKISEYNNQEILQYNKQTDTTSFTTPSNYIVLPCKEFYHLKTKYGLDQKLSSEHKMLVWKEFKGKGYKLTDYIVEDFVNKHNSLKKGIQGGIKTTFNLDNNGLGFSDIEIKLFAMISADGCIRHNKNNKNYIEMHFKKKHKINRCISLLKEAGLLYNSCKGTHKDIFINFWIDEKISKDITIFWQANQHELDILSQECLLWDGHKGKHFVYFTSIKEYADLIQYAFAVNNIRCGIQIIKYANNWKDSYRVYLTKNNIVGFSPNKITTVQAEDKKKYCFTVPTGYFIARRNNNIFITGNCGMYSAKFDITDCDLKALDNFIKANIPSGFNINQKIQTTGFQNFNNLITDTCNQIGIDADKALRAVGSLGGGNHFIEAGYGADHKLWVTIHSGSRNFGLKVANYYQNIAKANLKKYFFDGQYKNLEFLLTNEQEGKEYLHDLKVAQMFAEYNRNFMMQKIVEFFHDNPVKVIESTHNFIEDNIIRKGATSAKMDQEVIIPFNMRDGIAICKGKGNKKYNYSAPHGAGRILSRKKAKAELNMEQFTKEMEGIYTTTAVAETLDESPMAYKDKDIILANIQETVEVVEMIKPVYNFKAIT